MSIWCESSCTVCAPHVHEAFEDIDLDNSTKITGDELHKWLYMVLQSQMEHAQEARKDGEESEEDWQKNYDAEVKAAALSMRESEDAGIEPSQFRTEFEMVDIDKDGFVSYEEAMAEIDGRFEETINLPQEEKMPDEEKETFMANLMKDMNLMKVCGTRMGRGLTLHSTRHSVLFSIKRLHARRNTRAPSTKQLIWMGMASKIFLNSSTTA
jgi:Ca2+-binding EF-hand superfamily protein